MLCFAALGRPINEDQRASLAAKFLFAVMGARQWREQNGGPSMIAAAEIVSAAVIKALCLGRKCS